VLPATVATDAADSANIATITLRIMDLLHVTQTPRRLFNKTPRRGQCSVI
jgi:hypothetical protein